MFVLCRRDLDLECECMIGSGLVFVPMMRFQKSVQEPNIVLNRSVKLVCELLVFDSFLRCSLLVLLVSSNRFHNNEFGIDQC
jgi:hypothetical protein